MLTINININGTKQELTVQQAKELYRELDSIFKNIGMPYFPGTEPMTPETEKELQGLIDSVNISDIKFA